VAQGKGEKNPACRREGGDRRKIKKTILKRVKGEGWTLILFFIRTGSQEKTKRILNSGRGGRGERASTLDYVKDTKKKVKKGLYCKEKGIVRLSPTGK